MARPRPSANAPSSATSPNITPASTPVRRFGYRPIRARSSRSATRSRSRSTPRNAVYFAVPPSDDGSIFVTTQVENIHIQGNEHWTQKGDAKLFLWEKRRAQNSPDKGTILFVHGSSM